MDLDSLRQLQQKITNTWKILRLDETQQRVFDLEGEMNKEGFWKNPERAKQVAQELNTLQVELHRWQDIKREVDETLLLGEIAEQSHDEAEQKKLVNKSTELQKRFADLEFYIMLGGLYDAHDAIVAIYAGAGGVDAQDWAQMLLRMILRFCEQRGWSVDVVDETRGQEAGVKSATLHVRGRYAYGYLQSENGVHRLVRISPFDAEKMRHTSFARLEVIPDLGDVAEINIKEEDLRVDVFRSGGHGGQNVNTTDSAVRVVHLPSGIVVTCQNEKSQHQNKATALKILKSKLHKKFLDEQEAEKRQLRGEFTSAAWGNQIRSYVLHPYKMVKDHRTDFETHDPIAVLDGDLQNFMEAYLRWKTSQVK